MNPSRLFKRPAFFTPLLVGAILLLLVPVESRAQGVLDAISQEVNGIFEKAKPAVVRIRASQFNSDGDIQYVGSGFFIDGKGTILTAERIIGDSTEAKVEYNGQSLDAKILGRDVRSGIALLRVTTGVTPFLKFTETNNLKTGIFVVAVGFPDNRPVAPSFGPIAGFDAQFATPGGNRFFCTTHIRANSPLVPGQVGGPLLNTKGEVIGVMVRAVEDGKAVYALPAPAANRILADFRQTGAAKHGWVGVGFTETALSEEESHHVKISQLFQDTPASTSGLQTGDVVIKIGDREIFKPSDAMDAAFFSKVGENLPVQVQRGNKVLTFKFTVSERPKTQPSPLNTPASGSGVLTPNEIKPPGTQLPEPIKINGTNATPNP
jgi:S1-C subfamily serine protease